MNILEKRPLALIIILFLGSFSFLVKQSYAFMLILAASGIALLIFTFIFENFFTTKAFVRVLSVTVILASLMAILFQALFFPSNYYGKDVALKGKVYEKTESDGLITYVISSEAINQMSDGHKLLLVIDEQDPISQIAVGDYININTKIVSLEDEFSDYSSYYVSRGISAILDGYTDYEIISRGHFVFTAMLTKMRLTVCNMLIDKTDNDTGGFISALMMGEFSLIDAETKLDFKRLGITHVLALSGMHLVIISYALSKLLSLFRPGKKPKTLISVLFCLFYMMITGCPASVVRSTLMMLVTGLLYLSMQARDSITNLAISVLFIILIEPYAVFDLSLWLSAFATLGVICVSMLLPKQKKTKSVLIRLCRIVLEALAASFFAIGASFPIILAFFSETSLISPISTLLISFIVEVIMYISLAFIASWGVLPLGKILIFLTDVVDLSTDMLSRIRYIFVSTDFLIVKVCAITFCVFFYALLLFKFKKKALAITLSVILFITTFLLAGICTVTIAENEDIIFSPNEAGDTILLKGDGDTSAIYTGELSLYSAGQIKRFYTDNCIYYLDNLIFCGYGSESPLFIQSVLSDIKTQTIHLPAPNNAAEMHIAEKTAFLLADSSCELKFYKQNEDLMLSGYIFNLFYYDKYLGNTTGECSYTLKTDDWCAAFFTRRISSESEAVLKYIFDEADTVVLGSSGDADINLTSLDSIPTGASEIIYGGCVVLDENVILQYEKIGVVLTKATTPISIKR